MSVTRRKDTKSVRWRARWTEVDGKVKTKDFRTKVEAVQFEAQMRTEVRKGEYSNPHAAKTVLFRVYEDWKQTESKRKPKTRASYDSLWKCLVEPQWSRRRINSITRSEVMKWVHECKSATGKKVSPSRIGQALVLLNLLLRHAVDMGLINRSPLGDLRGIKPKNQTQKEVVVLTEEQLLKLADACGDYRTMILLVGVLGLRWAELVGLRPEDFDFREKTISISKSLSEINGKFAEVTTKSGKSRVLPIPDFLLVELKELVLATEPGACVFKSKKGGTLRSSNFARRIYKPAIETSGIPQITFHDLRHTAISQQIESGTDVVAVSKIAGHSNPSTTLKIYAHQLDRSKDEVRKSIDDKYQNLVSTRFLPGSDSQLA